MRRSRNENQYQYEDQYEERSEFAQIRRAQTEYKQMRRAQAELSQTEQRKQIRQMRKERRRRIRRRRLCFLAALILFCGVGHVVRSRNMPSEEAPQVAEINGVPVFQMLVDPETPGRPGTKKKIKYIVIHETGNTGRNAGAASHASYLSESVKTEAKSWHYTVDDHEIYHHIPDNEIAFHAGDQLRENGGNLNGIGIEMCVNPENDYEKTLRHTAALTAHLMKDYDLSIKDVKKHQDFSGKNCPEQLLEAGRWDEFLDMVREEL